MAEAPARGLAVSQSIKGYAGPAAELLVLALWFAGVVRANTDLIAGRFPLFMDEQIVFDGVRNILHPARLKDFVYAIVNGGDQRYGRILWNVTALLSWIPDRLWGDPGLIVAERMTQAVILAATIVLLAMLFLRTWPFRLLLTSLLLVMPYASYYATQPKPEPIELFFIAVFLYWHKKRNFGFGSHWSLLGVAFGAKIAVLPLVLVFVIDAAWRERRDGGAVLVRAIDAAAMFLLGWGIAVPFLLIPDAFRDPVHWRVPLGIGLLTFFLSRHAIFSRTKFPAVGHSLVAIFAFGLGLIASWQKLSAGLDVALALGLFTLFLLRHTPFSRAKYQTSAKSLVAIFSFVFGFIAGWQKLGTWLGFTFRNTTHAADESGVNAYSWLSYFIKTWLVAPAILSVVALGCACVLVIIGIRRYLHRKGQDGLEPELLLIAGGIAMIAAIFISSHRLWGFYLLPGMTLLLAGLVSLAEKSLTPPFRAAAPWIQRSTAVAAAILYGVMGLAWWAPSHEREIGKLARRTDDPSYHRQYATYRILISALADYAKSQGRQVSVQFDPVLFQPADTPSYKLAPFWGRYTSWALNYDLLVFGPDHVPGHATPPPRDSLDYPSFLAERSAYAQYVIEPGQECRRVQCYERLMRLPDGGEILVRRTRDS